MCGRYSLADQTDLETRFEAEWVEKGWLSPRFNIAPTQAAPTVTSRSSRRIERMRWGLVPFWAKDAKIGNRLINARAETAATTPAFRTSFRSKRCLVVADGFYEWQRDGKTRTPFRFRLRGGGVFAFAGLYDRWEDPDGGLLSTFTIVTTESNELVGRIHERMPVILPQEAEQAWLDPEVDDPSQLEPLLKPFPAGSMEAYRVSTEVNYSRNESPELIEPVEAAGTDRLPGI